MVAEIHWRIENWLWHAIPINMVGKDEVTIFCSFEFLFGGTGLHLHSYLSTHPSTVSFFLSPCLLLQHSVKLYCYSAPTCLCLHILPHSHTFLSIYPVLSLKQQYLLVLKFICWNITWNFRSFVQIIKYYNENLHMLLMSWELWFLVDHHIFKHFIF